VQNFDTVTLNMGVKCKWAIEKFFWFWSINRCEPITDNTQDRAIVLQKVNRTLWRDLTYIIHDFVCLSVSFQLLQLKNFVYSDVIPCTLRSTYIPIAVRCVQCTLSIYLSFITPKQQICGAPSHR